MFLLRLCSISRPCIALVFVFYALAGSLSTALRCDSNKFPFPSGECIEFVTSQTAANLDAHLECQNNNGIGLLTLLNFQKFEYLQRYIEILGEEGVDYWLGYYYRDMGGGLESRNGEHTHCGTPAAASTLFGTQDPLPPGVQVCVTVRKDGKLYRRACSESLPYICVQRINDTSTQTPGQPSPVETIKVLPDTKTSVLIQWLPPHNIGIFHPLLLRYELLYHTGEEFNMSQATSVSGLLPVQVDGSVSESGLSEFILRNLTADKQYVVTLRADATTYSSDIGTVVTFGNLTANTQYMVTLRPGTTSDIGTVGNYQPGEILAVVLPVACIVALVSLILMVGVISLVVQKLKREGDRPQIQTLKTESKSESDTKAVNMSALQDDDNMIVELEKQPF